MNTLTTGVGWYRIDPDKGTFKDETEPDGAWSLLDKPKTLEHYLWLPEPDGSIRYYTHDLKAHADRPILPPEPGEAEEPASPKAKPARKATAPRKG